MSECILVDDVADFVNILTDKIAANLVLHGIKECDAWQKASFVVANYVQAARQLEKVSLETKQEVQQAAEAKAEAKAAEAKKAAEVKLSDMKGMTAEQKARAFFK